MAGSPADRYPFTREILTSLSAVARDLRVFRGTPPGRVHDYPFTHLYSTCLFCNQPLGANEVVEAFPVGRRLAFDQARGRLWVVCRKCEKWNLTPLEERWEAIETCERLFRDTRKRMSTDNIGLARLAEGLELVRIGEPQRPEFAAWRYGDQFGRRRRRHELLATAGGVIALGAAASNIAGVAAGSLVFGSLQLAGMVAHTRRNRRVIFRGSDSTGDPFFVRASEAMHTRLVPNADDQKWALQFRLGKEGIRGKPILTGGEARRAAAQVMPHRNEFGSDRKRIAKAVVRLEEAGSPEQFLAWAARNHQSLWKESYGDVWLGIEMAVNEENERRALEDELALLELAWKDAEEIAAIADKLVPPPGVQIALRALKREVKQG